MHDRCRPGACPRDPLASARRDDPATLASLPAAGMGPGTKCRDDSLRSEERRVGKECVVRVALGGRRILKKKRYDTPNTHTIHQLNIKSNSDTLTSQSDLT